MRSNRAALFATVLALLALNPGNAASQETETLSKGVFLVADREMRDPRFREAVILLLSTDHNGAAGLIINKPTDSKLSELLPEMRKAELRKDRLYYGGPVGSNQMLMLLRSKGAIKDAVRVLKEVSVSTDRAVLLEAIHQKKAGDEYRIFAGYAGWAAGQLEWELKLGQWRLVAASAEMVFHDNVEKIWPVLIRKSEEIIVRERNRIDAYALLVF
jgi:putative transcriptional regulator